MNQKKISQAKKPSTESQGNFVDKPTYKTEISEESNQNFERKKKLSTKNMFELSKPLLRLDDEPNKGAKLHVL